MLQKTCSGQRGGGPVLAGGGRGPPAPPGAGRLAYSIKLPHTHARGTACTHTHTHARHYTPATTSLCQYNTLSSPDLDYLESTCNAHIRSESEDVTMARTCRGLSRDTLKEITVLKKQRPPADIIFFQQLA